jgi:ABC-2 type transport system permease protein
MAELTPQPPTPTWTAAQTRDQLAAVAWLRWRIFVNNFRSLNKKRSATRLALLILARILIYFFLAFFFVGPVAGSAVLGYYAVAHRHASLLDDLTWTVFGVSLFIGFNVAPANLGFDLTPLLRFPITFRAYLAIRLFFGLFSLRNVVATLSLLAAAVGIGIADRALFPWAFLVLGAFAIHNLFFLRMVFAWVDRWMATRRTREIFGAIVLFASLGFQLMVSGGSHGQTAARFAAVKRLLAPLHPIAQYMPPSLAAGAIERTLPGATHAAFGTAVACLLGVIAFGLAFLAIFATRLTREFHGENLSEASRRTPRPTPRTADPEPAPSPKSTTAAELASTPAFRLPSTVAACLEKELIYLRRSGAQLYGLITPLFFVFILTRRHSLFSNTPMMLPYAVCYVLFGLLANLYNVLGADGPGFQLYLLAPVRLRDVILAKNIVSGSVIVLEIVLTCIAVTFISGGVPSAPILSATLVWAAVALFTNMTVGNLRSILAPQRFELGKQRRAVTGKGSGFFSLGILLATLAVGVPIIYACQHFNVLWLATVLFAVLAAGAVAAYIIVLGRLDGIALRRRDDIGEALCKT